MSIVSRVVNHISSSIVRSASCPVGIEKQNVKVKKKLLDIVAIRHPAE